MSRRQLIVNLLIAILIAGGLLSILGLQRYSPKTVVPVPIFPVSPSVTLSPESSFTPTLRPTRTPFRMVTSTPTQTRTPTPTSTRTLTPTATLPDLANIAGIYGYGQLLPLSCESRSASDWARHFGFEVHEMDVMKQLPKSDDPELGFVGSPYGGWGQIPPNPYGVHAGPIATVLRSYGAKAEAVRNLNWEQLKAEITAGRPVIVWVTGHVEKGQGVQIEINGITRTVARYEHTVILIGYDPEHVTILDGKQVYRRPLDTFLVSWGALENMAVIWNESLEP